MGIVGHNVFCISSHGTVHKLVVVNILRNEAKMDVDLLIISGVESSYRLNNIMSYFTCRLPCKNLFVLMKYFCVNAEANLAIKNICPYLMIRTFAGQGLQ